MPNNGDTFGSGLTESTYYDNLPQLLSLLADNTANEISPRDVRDTIYSLWERNIIGLQGNTSTKYIAPNPTLRNKYLIGKSTTNGGVNTLSGAILSSDYDVFFYNSKDDASGTTSTKVGFLAGVTTTLFTTAPYFLAAENSGKIDLSLINSNGDLTVNGTYKVNLLNGANGFRLESGALYPASAGSIIGRATDRLQTLYMGGTINFQNQLSFTGGITFANTGKGTFPEIECDTFVGVGASTGYALITNGNGTATFQPLTNYVGVNNGTVGKVAYYTAAGAVSSLNDLQYTTRVEHIGSEFYFANKLNSTNISIDSSNKLMTLTASKIKMNSTVDLMGTFEFARSGNSVFNVTGTKVSTIDSIVIANIAASKNIMTLQGDDIFIQTADLHFANGLSDSFIKKDGTNSGSGKLSILGGAGNNGKGGDIEMFGGSGVASAGTSGNVTLKGGHSTSNMLGDPTINPGYVTLQGGSYDDSTLINAGKLIVSPTQSGFSLFGTYTQGGYVRMQGGSFSGVNGSVITAEGGSQSDGSGGNILLDAGTAGSDLSKIGKVKIANGALCIKRADLSNDIIQLEPSNTANAVFNIQYPKIVLGNNTSEVEMYLLSSGDLGFNTQVAKLYFKDRNHHIGYDASIFDGPVLSGYVGTRFVRTDGANSTLLFEVRDDGIFGQRIAAESASNKPKVLIDSSTFKMYIDSSSTSDIRLKENIVEMHGVLDTIDSIGAYKYNLKGESNTQLGLIAQELLELYPEVIIENGEYYGINYEKLTPILLQAIKELKTRVEKLENGK